MPASDPDLLRLSVRDPRAFEEIFERHYDAVSVFLRRRVDSSVADDLASDVFLTAFRRRADFDADQLSARPWLYGIAHNLLRSAYRGHSRDRVLLKRLESTEPSEDEAEAVIDRAAAQQMRGELRLALGRLDAHQRDALLMTAWEGLSPTEIAVVLGVPAATVRSWLFRARGAVRAALEAEAQAAGKQERTTQR